MNVVASAMSDAVPEVDRERRLREEDAVVLRGSAARGQKRRRRAVDLAFVLSEVVTIQ